MPPRAAADGFGSDAHFNLPVSVTTDSAGNVYVADTENSTIRKITPAGAVSTFAGFAGNFGSADGAGTNAQFYGPQGIAADSAGFLYVADTANATIRKISPAGTVSIFAGSAGNFNSFDGTGTNACFYQPEGLAVDGAGNVYVADTWNHTIRKITPAGAVSTLAGLAGNFGAADGTNSKARFNRPAGIALDSATNLFVTDFLNHTIRKITPGGTVSTIAGLPGVWGSADGTNSAARFFQPQGICAADAATLFVVDSGNQTLRKVSASGTNWVVSTVAGLSGTAGHADGTGTAAQFYFPAGARAGRCGLSLHGGCRQQCHPHDAGRGARAAILRRAESTGAYLACVSSGLRFGDGRHSLSRRAVDAPYEWDRDGGEQPGPHQQRGRHGGLLPAAQAVACAS